MKKMWQKYTPGKRLLALLLAVLMLGDTFTVSAATTEVSTEVVETEVETEESMEAVVEESQTVEGEVVEPEVIEEEPQEQEEEVTVEETPVVEEIPVMEEIPMLTTSTSDAVDTPEETDEWGQLAYEVYAGDNNNIYTWNSGYQLQENENVTVYNELWFLNLRFEKNDNVDVTTASSYVTISVEYEDGTVKDASLADYVDYDSSVVFGYEWDITDVIHGQDYTISVKVGEVTKTYNVMYSYPSYVWEGNEYEGIPYSFYNGTSITLKESNIDGIGGYYVADSTGAAVIYDSTDMPAAAKQEWDATYKAEYGTYGEKSTYKNHFGDTVTRYSNLYVFEYGEGEVYYPTIKVVKASVQGNFSFKSNEGNTVSGTYFRTKGTLPTYTFVCDGKVFTLGEMEGLIEVPYTEGPLEFVLYCDGKPATIAQASDITISDITVNFQSNALEIDTSNGLTLRISEVYHTGEEQVYALEDYMRDAFILKYNYVNNITGANGSAEYTVAPEEVRVYLWGTEGKTIYLSTSSKNEIDINEYNGASISWRSPRASTGSAIVVTAGKNAPITIDNKNSNSYMGRYNGNEYVTKYTPVSFDKLGETKLTSTYKATDGKTYKKEVTIKLVSKEPKLLFGTYDDNMEFVELPDEMYVEVGEYFQIVTNVVPKILSNVSVKSSNSNVGISGEIADGYSCFANCNTIGDATLTLSGKYNGTLYSKEILVHVTQPTGLHVRTVYGGNYNISYGNGRVSEIAVSNWGQSNQYVLFDDVDGNTEVVDIAAYSFDVYKIVETEEEVTSDYSVVIDNENNCFYVSPDFSYVDRSYNYVLRITASDGRTEDVKLTSWNMDNGAVYESYDPETDTLTGRIATVALIDGEDTSVYVAVSKNISDSTLYVSEHVKAAGVTFKSEVIAESEEYNIVKATFSYTRNSSYGVNGYSSGSIYTKNRELDCRLTFYRYASVEKEVPALSQYALSNFMNTYGTEYDIDGGVRIQDYEVALKTLDDGSKAIVLVGLLRDVQYISLPNRFTMYVTRENTDGTAVIVQTPISVIGVEDGMFDVTKGNVQPYMVEIPYRYTYFGTNFSGLTSADSGIQTLYHYSGEYTEPVFEIYNNMLFAQDASGVWQCVDTGNADTSVLVPEATVLRRTLIDEKINIDIVFAEGFSYEAKSAYLTDAEGNQTPFKVEWVDGNYYLVVDTASDNYDGAYSLTNGTYYLTWTPSVIVRDEMVELEDVKSKIMIVFDETAPTVKAQSSITINTYLGSDARVPLEITNSIGTEITSVTMTTNSAIEKAGLSISKDAESGQYFLNWREGASVPKNVKINVKYEVQGFTATTNNAIDVQTITVNGKKVQPKTALSKSTLTFSEYPYAAQEVTMSIADNHYSGAFDLEKTTYTVTAPKGGNASDITVVIKEDKTVSVSVYNNAVNGIYKVAIKPALCTEDELYATTATLTVNVKGTKPSVKFAEKVNVTLNSNYYNTTMELPALVYADKGAIVANYEVFNLPNDGNAVKTRVKTMPKGAAEGMVTLTAKFNGEADATTYDLSQLVLEAGVTQDAKAGNYVFNIDIPVSVDSGDGFDVVWMNITATVKVVNTLPSFKLSTSTVTLDANYPCIDEDDYYSYGIVNLIMEDGYTLEGFEYISPNVNAKETVGLYYDKDGTIYFELESYGLTSGGTYKITPVVKTANEEVIELKPVNVSLKVTNTSKYTLNSKVKSITVNSNIGELSTGTTFTTKGLNAADEYEYEYLFVPTNGYSQLYGGDLAVSGNEIIATNWEDAIDGKYTYNLVQAIGKGDELIGVTKSVAFTVTVKAKDLTIVPKTTSVTVYGDYCTADIVEGGGHYEVSIPISIKELPDTDLSNYFDYDETTGRVQLDNNSKVNAPTFLQFKDGKAELVVWVPCDENGNASKISNMTVTPVSKEGVSSFAKFTIKSITVKAGKPTGTFATKTLVLDRYQTSEVTNTVLDTNGYTISKLELVSILNTKKVDVSDLFDVTTNKGNITVTIKEGKMDEIANGKYTVTVTPYASVITTSDGTVVQEYDAAMNNCAFTFEVKKPTIKVSVSEKKVNLYPDTYAITSAPVEVIAMDGTTALEVSKVEVVAPTKNIVTAATITDNKLVFMAVADDTVEAEGPVYKSGTNKYTVKVYAKYNGGSEDILVGTIKDAVAVNVKALPKSITYTSNKLTFNPYLEESVVTSVKDAELLALMESSNDGYSFGYDISVVETTNKYKTLADDKKNDILTVTGNADGSIKVTAAKLPEKKATYYYSATVKFNQLAGEEVTTVKEYTFNFQVTVNATKPTAGLVKTTTELNNAYLGATTSTKVVLNTGSDLWTLADHMKWTVSIKSGNKDVTDAGYFSIALKQYGDGSYTNEVLFALGGCDAEDATKLFSVPAGTYKISVAPKATNGEDIIDLAPVTITMKVVSSRPTVTYKATKLTVNTYSNELVTTKLALKNGGTFVASDASEGASMITCTKLPKGVTSADGITVKLAADGTLSAVATRDAKSGTYTYAVTPVTVIGGYYVALDTKNISVVVTNTKPAATQSAKSVTVNTLFVDSYDAELTVGIKNAVVHAYTFDTTDIVVNEKNAARKAIAEILKENMSVAVDGNGDAVITVSLPSDAKETVKTGTYNFKVTPTVVTGTDAKEYGLATISFSVKVENTQPKITAKVPNKLDVLKANQGVDVQLTFAKQPYDALANITSVQLVKKNTTERVPEMWVDVTDSDFANGTVRIAAVANELKANATYSYQLLITTDKGLTYRSAVSIKTMQSKYTVTAKAANLYREVGSTKVEVDYTDGIRLDGVVVSTVMNGKSKLSADLFTSELRYQNGEAYILLTANGDLDKYEGKTLTVTVNVYPRGLGTNMKPTAVKIPVTIK